MTGSKKWKMMKFPCFCVNNIYLTNTIFIVYHLRSLVVKRSTKAVKNQHVNADKVISQTVMSVAKLPVSIPNTTCK